MYTCIHIGILFNYIYNYIIYIFTPTWNDQLQLTTVHYVWGFVEAQLRRKKKNVQNLLGFDASEFRPICFQCYYGIVIFFAMPCLLFTTLSSASSAL